MRADERVLVLMSKLAARIRDRYLREDILACISDWQDLSRTYTPAERARDVRLDCEPARLVTAGGSGVEYMERLNAEYEKLGTLHRVVQERDELKREMRKLAELALEYLNDTEEEEGHTNRCAHSMAAGKPCNLNWCGNDEHRRLANALRAFLNHEKADG